MEPAEVTLVVGRNASEPVGVQVVQCGDFYLDLHARSANPAAVGIQVDGESMWTVSRDLDHESAPFLFNSGDIFTIRKSVGRYRRVLPPYEICELYDLEIAPVGLMVLIVQKRAAILF
jgi:hypothetical protein